MDNFNWTLQEIFQMTLCEVHFVLYHQNAYFVNIVVYQCLRDNIDSNRGECHESSHHYWHFITCGKNLITTIPCHFFFTIFFVDFNNKIFSFLFYFVVYYFNCCDNYTSLRDTGSSYFFVVVFVLNRSKSFQYLTSTTKSHLLPLICISPKNLTFTFI